MDTLDIDSVHDVMLSLYEQTLKHNSDTQTYDDLTRISFGYYHLIRRYQDIDPTLDFKGMFFYFFFTLLPAHHFCECFSCGDRKKNNTYDFFSNC